MKRIASLFLIFSLSCFCLAAIHQQVKLKTVKLPHGRTRVPVGSIDLITEIPVRGDSSIYIFNGYENVISLKRNEFKKGYLVTTMSNDGDTEVTVFDQNGDGFPEKVIKDKEGVLKAYKVQIQLIEIAK